jgi:hypothetical protein
MWREEVAGPFLELPGCLTRFVLLRACFGRELCFGGCGGGSSEATGADKRCKMDWTRRESGISSIASYGRVGDCGIA